MSECALEVELANKWDRCDGCGREIPKGERVISNIASCCGGGCVRMLCGRCVGVAARLIFVDVEEA